MQDEQQLVALAAALGAETIAGWSAAERALARRVRRASAPPLDRTGLDGVRREIAAGGDPLGEAFCQLRSPHTRRPMGATYTPDVIVQAMIDRIQAALPAPARVVDPGTGSGRFLVAAGRRFRHAQLVGVELDPVAAFLARGHLAAAGLGARSEIIVADYRGLALPRIEGRTAFVGNPPYVRHHQIAPAWKAWLSDAAASLGFTASQLAGLHVHFYLATVRHARPGDVGSFVTAAEWLDVNYGRLLRQLFLGPLGGRAITLIEPTAQPFPDAATTAAITTFDIGAVTHAVRLRLIPTLASPTSTSTSIWTPRGRLVARARLEQAARWTPLVRARRQRRQHFVELGELCRVHRGQVTGANRIWIAGDHSHGLPEALLFASVTRARELFGTPAGVLQDASQLRRVIDIPADLDVFDPPTRRRVEAFLTIARSLGGDRGYIARTRKCWWAVALREPAPILATYMARRPPAFVRNLAGARHINIAHGIYPREPMSADVLTALATWLARSVSTADGRTYAGGLTKFEPREMERLLVPDTLHLTAQ
jgi:adenine-specific DNA-methyltransferase